MDWKMLVAAAIALVAAYFVFKVVFRVSKDAGL